MKSYQGVRLGLSLVLLVWGPSLASCDDGGSSAAAGGAGNSGGAPGTSSGVNMALCLNCGNAQCATPASACTNSTGCSALLPCLLNCAGGDSACQNNCVTAAANDSAAIVTAADYVACLSVQCASSCVPTNAGVGGGGNVATGGAAPTTSAVPSCTGTPTYPACSQYQGNCTDMAGCSSQAAGSCGGQVPECFSITSATSCTAAGCMWEGMCSGNAVACSTNTTQAACSQRSWCNWIPSTRCVGTATPCAQLPIATCTKTPGCTVR